MTEDPEPTTPDDVEGSTAPEGDAGAAQGPSDPGPSAGASDAHAEPPADADESPADPGEPPDNSGEPAVDPGEPPDDSGERPAERAEEEEEQQEDVERSESIRRCDYCRLPCPTTLVTLQRDDVTYEFCSEACRDALSESDRVFTEYHGYRRLQPGVSALDSSLPEGIPRNSFVMLTDLAGTRTEALQAELVWRALQRGEPVVFMSFLEPPVSVIQEFLSLEWNVLPSLEDGTLHILDCFTYRVDDRERMQDRMSTWNAHLQGVAEQSTTTVRDPSDVSQLENRLDGVLEELGMQDRGIVVVDTLTELGSLVQPVQAYNFVKNVRADVCKGRFVPIFAGATLTGDGEGFPHDLRYMVDGIVEMRLNEELVDGALVKQIRTRKMGGVLTYPEWESYEYTAGKGIVTFDPLEELEAARARAERVAEGEDSPQAEEKEEDAGSGSESVGDDGGSGSAGADDGGAEDPDGGGGGDATSGAGGGGDGSTDTGGGSGPGEDSSDGPNDVREGDPDGDDVAPAADETDAANGEYTD